MPPASLDVHSLTVVRAGRTVVDAVSLAVNPHEIVTVIGPNGAGKTSLLEAVVGVGLRATGTVTFAGQRIASLREAARVFSYMRDDSEPAAELRVRDVIRHAARFGAAPRELADDLIDRLRIGPLLRRRGGALSKGERRRVTLCAALITTRPVIVLDEPLGVFDPLQAIEVCEVLRERAATGVSVLMTAHQMSDAEKIATRVFIMNRGREVAAGTVQELRDEVDAPGASLEEVFLKLLRRSGDAAA